MAALGPDADVLTREHRLDDGYGPTSPFARLVERRGQILLLGAPLETLTILHHAEAMADAPNKRRVRFPARVRTSDGVEDVEIDVIDTSHGAFDYDALELGGLDFFEVIARAALAAGIGRAARIADAASHLFEADALGRFAVALAGAPLRPPLLTLGSTLPFWRRRSLAAILTTHVSEPELRRKGPLADVCGEEAGGNLKLAVRMRLTGSDDAAIRWHPCRVNGIRGRSAEVRREARRLTLSEPDVNP